MRILIIQLKRIGDFILTAPAVTALREAYPKAEIVMLVPGNVADLAKCLPAVNRVITYQSGGTNLEAWGSALVGEWDTCLDFTGTDRSAFLVTLSRAKHRIGYAKFANGLRKLAYTKLCEASVRDLHTVDFHLALVEEALAKSRSERQQAQRHKGQHPAFSIQQPFLVPPEAQAKVHSLLKSHGISTRFAIVHPGTVREEKFWLDERWAEVIEVLHTKHHLPVVITGAGDGLEKAHLIALRKHLCVPVLDLTGQLTLVGLAGLIAQCHIILGVDSMAMHLAAMFAKPQIALFGPTNPFHWRARHERAVVLTPGHDEPQNIFIAHAKKRGMKQISTSAVLGAMRVFFS